MSKTSLLCLIFYEKAKVSFKFRAKQVQPNVSENLKNSSKKSSFLSQSFDNSKTATFPPQKWWSSAHLSEFAHFFAIGTGRLLHSQGGVKLIGNFFTKIYKLMLVLRFGYCSQDFFLYFDRKRIFFACFVAFEFVISCLLLALVVGGVAFISRTYLVKHGCGGYLNILVLWSIYTLW